MIIIFHTLYFVVKHCVKIYRYIKLVKEFQALRILGDVRIQESCEQSTNLDLRFNPPLYKQRYASVQQILLTEKWRTRVKKVVEFGCCELSFFPFLKHLYDINEIVFVDIDEEILEAHSYKTSPLTIDYLKERPTPLKVQVLAGNAAQPNTRLRGADAVVAIELIEHMYPESLEALPYNVFHFIKPLIAVFTTPNYEFNVFFPELEKFRHYDHKFEWTREQFQTWAINITRRFPSYVVQFDGIGAGPPGSESLGCCTQIAIFYKHSDDDDDDEQLSEVPKICREIFKPADADKNLDESYGICTYCSYMRQITEFELDDKAVYKEIHLEEYPYFVDDRTQEERMLDDVRYRIYSATSSNRFYNEEKGRIEWPLDELIANEDGYFTTVSELSKILAKANFDLQECLSFNFNRNTLCIVHSLTMENESTNPSSDGNTSDDKHNWNIASDESDWEGEYKQTVKIAEETIEKKPEKFEDVTIEDSHGSNSVTKEQVPLIIHAVPTTLQNAETKEIKKDFNISKKTASSYSKLASTSATCNKDLVPKKGTNVKNKDLTTSPQGTSKESGKKKNDSVASGVDEKKCYKKSIELKVHDSTLSQAINGSKSIRSSKSPITHNTKANPKTKVITTSSLKRFSAKIEDTPLPSTSDLKKRKKGKKSDEDKEDIKALTECIIYNTLNNIPEVEEPIEQPSTSEVTSGIKLSDDPLEDLSLKHEEVREIVGEVLKNAEGINSARFESTEQPMEIEIVTEPISQELNHASREALFDPNSETDMLEEFEIPPPLQDHTTAVQFPVIAEQHNNIIVIGLNPTNDVEAIALPDNADPFPNWLLQLLGANVDEAESHDEPHFYCQGDGIGVHPSIIEVEIDEEESSTDSSSSHHEAEPGYTSSDSGLVQLPTDDADDRTEAEETAREVHLNRSTPGNTSAAESADEFFDSLEDTLTITPTRQNSQSRKN